MGDEFCNLSARERKVLWLTVVEGRSLTEVGDHLDTTVGGAAALAYRARRRLKEALLKRERETIEQRFGRRAAA